MHENLKYTLKLDQGIREFKTFDQKDPLTKSDRAEISDWQAIYADNKYGTHFLIYAKFIGEKDTDGFHVSRIQLYLQNYKGAVSLGFVDHAIIEEMDIEKDDPDNDNRFPDRRKFYLQIGLQGLNIVRSTYNFEPEKNLILKNGDIIMTDTIFVPINSQISKIFDSSNVSNADFVDELFMERLGSDIFITEDGKELLMELQALDKGFVDASFLAHEKDNSRESVQLYSKSVLENYRVREKRSRPYPCIPIYSICEVK
ncbi:MAG: hypothetical protein AAGB24_06890 [Bacteroidota bacterium]